MKKMKWQVFGILLIIFIFAQLINCSKFKKLVGFDDEDKSFERVLVSDDWKAGFYLVCWDGKDSQGNFVSAGQYFFKIKMKAGDFSKDIMVEALEGSSGSLNQPPQLPEPPQGQPLPTHFDLQVQPNPFYIQDRTYAIMSLSMSADVELTVTN